MSITESTADNRALHDPDVQLMLRVRDDDAAAFESLVHRYQPRLMTVMKNYVGGGPQAEDLVQEVFLRVYRARRRYRPEARFATWLFTIANNVAANTLRSLARRREVNLAGRVDGSGAVTLEQLVQEASGLMPTRQLAKSEMSEIIHLAMQTLNDRQRMAVLLCKFEHMSYADIAQAMQLSPSAVKSLLCRARASLRTVLEPYLADGSRPEL